MDPRLLEYYNLELQHLREVGGEFAQEFPKIAGRLGLETFECADPYVERLLESFAFLAARVHLKIDAEFPDFTQHLLEMVYPHYLAPIPSMTVVHFSPDMTEGSLKDGFVIERGDVLRSLLGKGDQTPCLYRTSHDVTLWPIRLTEAEYFARSAASMSDLPNIKGVKAGIRFRLETTIAHQFQDLSLDRLPIFLRGVGELPMHLYEQMFSNAVAIVVRPAQSPAPWREVLSPDQIRRVGFGNDEALLPFAPQSFSGYRLLQEYFAFPERFMFVEFTGLNSAVRKAECSELEIVVLFDRGDRMLENSVEVDDFELFCAPAINLFPQRCDRIHIDYKQPEFHVVPDRTRPLDLEVFDIEEVIGYGTHADERQDFLPFYAFNDLSEHRAHEAYFAISRMPRTLSQKQRRYGPRSSYVGSETYISLVDSSASAYSHSLKQLAVRALCTNRDLPMHMPIGVGRTDFTMESGAPVEEVRAIAGPTPPRPSLVYARGESGWRLISHLALNYLSLSDSDTREGAVGLRDLLRVYIDSKNTVLQKQIEGIRSVQSTPITRRLPLEGPVAFGRGLEVAVTFDETAYEGTGIFLLGCVLEEFFARYVSINSFTETVIRTVDRGEIKRWPMRTGRRPTL